MTLEAEFHGKWRKQLEANEARFQAIVDNGRSEVFVTKNQTVTIRCGSDEEGGEIQIQDGNIPYGEKPRAEAFVIPLVFTVPVDPLSATHIAWHGRGESLLTVRHFSNRFLEHREQL